jgi:hypothetical protein
MFKIQKIEPSMRELTPTLHVHLHVEYELKNSCHLEVKGSMFSSDNRLLSVGKEIRNSPNDQISSCDINLNNDSASEDFVTELYFPVDANSFDYVEKLRLAGDNDVNLKFEFTIVVIEHNFAFGDESLTLRDNNQSLGEVNLFKVKEYKETRDSRIPFSDWVSKYKNNLGFGKVIRN